MGNCCIFVHSVHIHPVLSFTGLASTDKEPKATPLLQLKSDMPPCNLPCSLQPTDTTHGSGSWFMWNALNGEAHHFSKSALSVAPGFRAQWIHPRS